MTLGRVIKDTVFQEECERMNIRTENIQKLIRRLEEFGGSYMGGGI